MQRLTSPPAGRPDPFCMQLSIPAATVAVPVAAAAAAAAAAIFYNPETPGEAWPVRWHGVLLPPGPTPVGCSKEVSPEKKSRGGELTL